MEIKENKIIFYDKQEIVDNFKVFSNIGFNSVIYNYNNDILMKVLKREANEEEVELISKIRKINPEYFSVPVLDLEIANKIYGYTMQKIKGHRIENLPSTFPIDRFIFAFGNEFEKEVYKLTKERIQLFDVKFDNVLFNIDSNKMVLLDIDGNTINHISSTDELYYENLCNILNVIIESLLNISLFSFQTADLGKEQLKEGKNLCESLLFIKEYIENIYNRKIHDIGDFARCRTLMEDNDN